MRFDVITLFAPMFDAVTAQGVSGRAFGRGLWALKCWNPRDFAVDAYRTIDDRPYGGGPGMVMMAEPLAAALDAARQARALAGLPVAPTVALSPQGRSLDHGRIEALVDQRGCILVCGRYEGIDQRLLDSRIDEEWAIGDFVVSGGELPAMMAIDAAVRLVPGVLNDAGSAQQDSFATGLLDCPHYTRPESFEGREVPAVLLSGHHARIARWRRDQALINTVRRRPELIVAAREQGRLDRDDERLLASLSPVGR